MAGPLEVWEEEVGQDNVVPDSHCQDNEIPEADNSTLKDIFREDDSPTDTSAEENNNIPSAAPIEDGIPSAPTIMHAETKARKSIIQGKQPIWMKDYVTKMKPK